MSAGFHYRNLIFGICFWLITLNMFLSSNDSQVRVQIQQYNIISGNGEYEFAFQF